MVWRRILGREELTQVEARQGFLDRPVLMVLIASLAMVCVLFGLLFQASRAPFRAERLVRCPI